MIWLGEYPVNGKVFFLWNTNDQTGASITRSTDGTCKIYKGNLTAATWIVERTSLSGVTQTEDFDGATGMHAVAIDLSDNTDAGFYAAGNEYQVAMAGMVIDTKTVNAVLAHFSIERSGGILALLKDGTSGLAQLVRSTTPANTLDVSATGEAGLDFNNVKDATGAHTLTNITVPVTTSVTNRVSANADQIDGVAWTAHTAGYAPADVRSNVKKNTALAKFAFLMTDSTNHNPSAGLAVTVTRSIDGGAFAAGTLSAVTAVSNGIYTVDFGAGDLNGNVIVLRATAAASDDTFERLVTFP